MEVSAFPGWMMKDPLAIFTIVQNEPVWLPIWINHYRKQVEPGHLYILDHDSEGEGAELLQDLKQIGVNVVPVHRRVSFDHAWLADTVQRFQQFLLCSYEAVLFAEVDEIIAVVPHSGHRNLQEYAATVLTNGREFVRCTGYEVVHKPQEEPPLNWSQPLLKQRSWWYRSELYSKPLLSSIPLTWEKGFHRTSNVLCRACHIDQDLLLIHLHKLDFDYCVERHKETALRKWSDPDKESGAGRQNRMVDPVELQTWFSRSIDDQRKDAQLVRIPVNVQTII